MYTDLIYNKKKLINKLFLSRKHVKTLKVQITTSKTQLSKTTISHCLAVWPKERHREIKTCRNNNYGDKTTIQQSSKRGRQYLLPFRTEEQQKKEVKGEKTEGETPPLHLLNLIVLSPVRKKSSFSLATKKERERKNLCSALEGEQIGCPSWKKGKNRFRDLGHVFHRFQTWQGSRDEADTFRTSEFVYSF